MPVTIVRIPHTGTRISDTYIHALSPAITPAEYAASIARLNAALQYTTPILRRLPLLFVLAGFVLFGLGGFLSVQQGAFSPLTAVGMALFVVGGCLSGRAQRGAVRNTAARMDAAVAVENAYYCRKMPPCVFRWRATVSSSQNEDGTTSHNTEYGLIVELGVSVVGGGYQQGMMLQQQPYMVMAGGQMRLMQPSSSPRFGAAGGVAPFPPMMQQQHVQYVPQSYGQQPSYDQSYVPQEYGQQQYEQPPAPYDPSCHHQHSHVPEQHHHHHYTEHYTPVYQQPDVPQMQQYEPPPSYTTYEAPQQTYEAQQTTYEQSSQPSYDQPS